jgi:hypothetical protein
VEAHTINLQPTRAAAVQCEGLLIIAGSNDPLLEQTIGLYNNLYPENLAVFGNMGSLGGIRSLKQDLCHIATSHLLQENGSDYNFDVAGQHVQPLPVVVNFCRRHQGLIVAKGNPRNIRQTADLGQPACGWSTASWAPAPGSCSTGNSNRRQINAASWRGTPTSASATWMWGWRCCPAGPMPVRASSR